MLALYGLNDCALADVPLLGGGTTPRRLGWPGYKYDPKELNRKVPTERLFAPLQFGGLLDKIAAIVPKNEAQRKALRRAMAVAELLPPDLADKQLITAFESILKAKTLQQSIDAAKYAEVLAISYYDYHG